MMDWEPKGRPVWPVLLVLLMLALAGCASQGNVPDNLGKKGEKAPLYLIGPGDSLQIFVWQNPELSVSVPVRPDGRITTPLVSDMQASGKTPSQLARDLEAELAAYIKNPVVTVMVTSFVGQSTEQIRVVGAAAQPQSIPYRARMTVLDVMIAVGGLNQFAAGNSAQLIRTVDGERKKIPVRLEDLLNEGEIEANRRVLPGDILIIPEAWF